MAAMQSKPDPAPDVTPHGRLDEGDVGRIMGYRVAQALAATNQVFATTIGSEIDLRPVEFTTLSLIHANPGLTASALASALAVTPPNITMWLDRLEGRGLIERERSETDRRAQHVSVTASGAGLVEQATQHLIASEQAALAGLSPGERAMLLELLRKAARCRRKGPAPSTAPPPKAGKPGKEAPAPASAPAPAPASAPTSSPARKRPRA